MRVIKQSKKGMIQPTLINLHSHEYSQELRYYLAVNLNRCVESCNILDNLSRRLCWNE